MEECKEVKEIQIMKKEKIDNETGKGERGKWQWENVRNKILDKTESRYGSLISQKK